MRIALVLEGGASRAYFSNGVMDSLMDNNIKCNYVIGTSAGIANGMSYVSWQRGRSLKIGTDYMQDKRYMGFKYLFKKGVKSYYNIPFVFDELPNIHLPYDYEAYNNFDGKAIAVLTDINSGKVKYMEVPQNDKSWKCVVASCALPLLFQPIEIDGNLYMDGGMSDSIPYKKPIEDGCDKVIVVLTRERDYIKDKESSLSLLKILYKKYPNLIKAIKNRPIDYNNSRKKLFELEDEGKVFVIAPNDTKNFSRVESSPEKLVELYKQGYDITEQKISDLKRYLQE